MPLHRTGSVPSRLFRATRRMLSVVCVIAGLAGLAARAGEPARRPVALVELEGTVNPGSADFLVRAISQARQQGSEALIIRLDTPGGMVESTREIVKAQLASSMPIVVWVGGSGARAGSAGVFITLASHVAAMAPATNIGAASPVSMGPGGGEEKQDETMKKKITNDLAAWAEGIAQQRGRNAEWAAEAVREAASLPAEAAVEKKVVDLIAPDLPALLAALDGRKVKTSDGEKTLTTNGAEIREIKMNAREVVLDGLGNPNIAMMLIGLGVLGLLAEFYHPGTVFPGVLGGVCLAIGLVATRMLPVRTGAIVLIIVGAALVAAEFFVTSYGLLAVAGVICLGLGSFLLIDPSDPSYLVDPDFGIDWLSVLPLLLVVGGTLALIVWKVTATRLRPQMTGALGLVGEEGRVVQEVGSTAGMIFLHGELWQARAAQPIAKDRRVRVEQVEGLVAKVVPVDAAASVPPM